MIAVTDLVHIRKAPQANDKAAKLHWPLNTVTYGFNDPGNGRVVMYACVVNPHVYRLAG